MQIFVEELLLERFRLDVRACLLGCGEHHFAQWAGDCRTGPEGGASQDHLSPGRFRLLFHVKREILAALDARLVGRDVNDALL